MNNKLEQIKKDLGINNTKSEKEFEIYQSYFPDLELKTLVILKQNGMLGRLFRGQRIDLVKENIHIPVCIKHYDAYENTNQSVPCVVKSKNPYWNKDNCLPYLSS